MYKLQKTHNTPKFKHRTLEISQNKDTLTTIWEHFVYKNKNN